jgi:hypothetical protein
MLNWLALRACVDTSEDVRHLANHVPDCELNTFAEDDHLGEKGREI